MGQGSGGRYALWWLVLGQERSCPLRLAWFPNLHQLRICLEPTKAPPSFAQSGRPCCVLLPPIGRRDRGPPCCSAPRQHCGTGSHVRATGSRGGWAGRGSDTCRLEAGPRGGQGGRVPLHLRLCGDSGRGRMRVKALELPTALRSCLSPRRADGLQPLWPGQTLPQHRQPGLAPLGLPNTCSPDTFTAPPSPCRSQGSRGRSRAISGHALVSRQKHWGRLRGETMGESCQVR